MFIYTDDVLIAVNISSCLLFPGLQLSEETPLLYFFLLKHVLLFFSTFFSYSVNSSCDNVSY